ncbi:MAG: DUF695 domain-containing protein [Bacteroidia bacterium]|nr:DUF695 domain-containing protein [Bacteroidia bacterium]
MHKILVLILLLSLTCLGGFAQGWDAYSTKIDTFEAIISVDLALRLEKTDETRPEALVIELRALETDERGFPRREEWDALNAIEDTLAGEIGRLGGRYVGRVMYNGKKQLFFYVADTQKVLNVLDPLISTFKAYHPGLKVTHDPEWQYYHSFLFPQPREFNAIVNQRQLAELQAAGDRLQTPRAIFHWAYFPNENDREMYRDRMKEARFRIDKEVRTTGEGKYPFALQFSRKDLPDLSLLNELTWQLYKLAEKYGGMYEGWECEAVEE